MMTLDLETLNDLGPVLVDAIAITGGADSPLVPLKTIFGQKHRQLTDEAQDALHFDRHFGDGATVQSQT